MAGLHFDITGDNKNLLRNLEGSKQGIRSLTREAEKESTSLDDIMKRIGQSAAAIGLGFSATQLVKDVARVRGEFQQLEVALTTMLGSEEKANALFGQLVNTAAKTPFDLKGVAGGAKQLLAYGVAAEEVNDTIIRLGDIAAGLSIPLGDLVYLYGTTMTQGRLFTQDLRQFMGRGIPLAEELAKQFGVTKDEVGGLVTAGKVGFPEVQKAIMAMTSEGGKFAGLMENQSKTITGQISNLEDAVDSMFNEIGKSTQGVISGTLTTATKLVENYEKVGEAIGVIATAYGSYKAALMISVAYQKAEMAVLRQAVLEKTLSAGATTAASNAELIAAGRTKLLTATTKQLIATLKAKSIALATNPYVLTAVAVTALVAGVYKLVTAKSAEEKAIERVNKKREESLKQREEEKNKIDGLLNTINDDTQTRTAQARAYDELSKIMPDYTKELSLEALQAMSAAEQTKRLNEELELLDFARAKEGLANYTSMLNEVVSASQNWGNVSEETKAYLRDALDVDWKGMKFEDAIAYLRTSIKGLEKEINDFNDANTSIDVKISNAEKAKEDAQAAFDAAKKALEEEQQRFEAEKEQFGFAIPISYDIETNYKRTKEELEKRNAELQSLTNTGEKKQVETPKNKKYWEDKKKAAEENRDKLDVSEIGGADWKKYEAEIKEANRMLERYSGKYLEDAKKRDEELLELKRQTAEELADINKSELDRELADVQDSYAKRMEELAKLEEEWKTAQGGRLTDEQSSALSSGRDAANDVRNKGVSDAVNAQMERYKQEKDEEKKHLEDLLEEFETYEQARERIAKEYAEKRKQMVNEDGSLKAGFTQGNLDNVNAQQREAEDALDQAMLEKSESYQAWLESIEGKTLDSLREALVQAKFALEMATMRGDSKGTATAKAQVDALSKQIKEMETSPKKRSLEDWRNLSEAISEAGDSFEGLSEELEAMGGDVGKVAGAILKSVGSIGSSTIGLINNITQLTQMSIKGTQETAETSSQAVKSVEKASVILAIISAAVQIITKIINLANQMHDAKYDKVIEENQAKIDSMKKSYEGLQEQLEETFGTGAVQTLQEMNASLEQQNKLIEEQKRAEEEKKKTDESAMQGYDDAIEQNRKQIEENKKAMEEAVFGDDIKSAIESFAEAYGDAIAEGKDLNQSMKDHAVEMMKQMVQEEIKAYIAGQGKLEALREKMALYFEDGVFSDSEIAAIKAESEAIGRDLDEKFAWAEDLLAEEDSSSSSSSSKRGIATASQESVDENNGRLMSIQLSMGEIKEQMIYTVTYLASMTSSISSGNHILSDIREQAVRANGLLEDIVKYTKPLNDKVGEVVSAVNRINSK